MIETVILPPDLAEKVRERIESGGATDAVDVVRAALEALEASEYDAFEAANLDAIRDKVARSLADPRPSVPAEEVFDRLDAAIRAAAKK